VNFVNCFYIYYLALDLSIGSNGRSLVSFDKKTLTFHLEITAVVASFMNEGMIWAIDLLNSSTSKLCPVNQVFYQWLASKSTSRSSVWYSFDKKMTKGHIDFPTYPLE